MPISISGKKEFPGSKTNDVTIAKKVTQKEKNKMPTESAQQLLGGLSQNVSPSWLESVLKYESFSLHNCSFLIRRFISSTLMIYDKMQSYKHTV